MVKLSHILFFVLIAKFSFGGDTWVQKDSIKGAPRSVASTFVLKNNGFYDGFIIGGLGENGFRRKMYSYTNWQDDWDDELSIGGASGEGLNRGSASSFTINNKGYICLGQGDTQPFMNDLWEYNPDSKSWSQKADFIGSPRRQAVSFEFDSIGIVGTGNDINGLCKDMFKYNPSSNSWQQLNDFGGSARKEAVAVKIGFYTYLGTGDDGVYQNDFWRYSIELDSWTQVSSIPDLPRKGAVAWGTFPQIFICSGELNNGNYTNQLWEYNYYSDQWVQRSDFPGTPRTNAICFTVEGLTYVGSGYNGEFLDDLYAYALLLEAPSIVQNNVKLYPCPSSSEVKIENIENYTHYSIYNLSGRKIEYNTISSTQLTLQKEKYQAGIYYLHLHEGKSTKTYVQKFIFI